MEKRGRFRTIGARATLPPASVHLYHDQALYKSAHGGLSPWHSDQYYWPLETDNTITAWIPLQDTPVAMNSVAFSAGSHHIALGRDLSIGEDSENIISDNLRREGVQNVGQEFTAGDVSFHAGPNYTDHPRRAMTVIYMEDGARLKQPENPNQEADRLAWCPGDSSGRCRGIRYKPRALREKWSACVRLHCVKTAISGEISLRLKVLGATPYPGCCATPPNISGRKRRLRESAELRQISKSSRQTQRGCLLSIGR